MLVVNGEKFDDLNDYVLRGRVIFPVEFIFLTLKEKCEAEQNNYQGIYHFYLIYNDGYDDYEFVFMDSLMDGNAEFLVLAPVYLPDTEIIRYIDYPRNRREHYPNFQIQYQPFSKLEYHTDKYELVDFNRVIQPIYTTDLYVTEDGINYRVQTTDVDVENNYLNIRLSNFSSDTLKVMEEDSYLGICRDYIVINTGEIIFEDYTIHDKDDVSLYLKPKNIPPRNSSNLPDYLSLDDGGGVFVVSRFIKCEYLPFFEK